MSKHKDKDSTFTNYNDDDPTDLDYTMDGYDTTVVTPDAGGITPSKGSGNPSVIYASCAHRGTTPLFALKRAGVRLTFGGAGSQVDDDDADLVIDLAHNFSHGDRKPKPFVEAPARGRWADLNRLCKPIATTPIVSLAWSDMTAPRHVPIGFWHAFAVNAFATLPHGGHVIVCCLGGHGRTGTCLAALIVAHSDHTAVSAVDYLRERHCPKAVESKTQADYLVSLEAARGPWVPGAHPVAMVPMPVPEQKPKLIIQSAAAKPLCAAHSGKSFCYLEASHAGDHRFPLS